MTTGTQVLFRLTNSINEKPHLGVFVRDGWYSSHAIVADSNGNQHSIMKDRITIAPSQIDPAN